MWQMCPPFGGGCNIQVLQGSLPYGVARLTVDQLISLKCWLFVNHLSTGQLIKKPPPIFNIDTQQFNSFPYFCTQENHETGYSCHSCSLRWYGAWLFQVIWMRKKCRAKDGSSIWPWRTRQMNPELAAEELQKRLDPFIWMWETIGMPDGFSGTMKHISVSDTRDPQIPCPRAYFASSKHDRHLITVQQAAIADAFFSRLKIYLYIMMELQQTAAEKFSISHRTLLTSRLLLYMI